MLIVETFADRLKDLMESEGYNNTTLGAALGINRKTVGRWILNQHTPNYIMLIKLAEHFNVSVDYLLCESGCVKITIPTNFNVSQVKPHFVETVSSFLIEKNITENAFCKILGLKHDSISKWTKGGYMPEAQTLVKLSRAMGISIDSLLGLE